MCATFRYPGQIWVDAHPAHAGTAAVAGQGTLDTHFTNARDGSTKYPGQPPGDAHCAPAGTAAVAGQNSFDAQATDACGSGTKYPGQPPGDAHCAPAGTAAAIDQSPSDAQRKRVCGGGTFFDQPSTVVGIDPGRNGAIAVLDETGKLLDVVDMPVTREPSGRSATNAPLLAEIIVRSHARIAFCEFVGARPTDAKVAAFAFGRARGVIEGVCGAYNIPIDFIAPAAWKRLAGVPPGVENKQVARTKAIARWPDKAEWFKRKGDVDRAEAALIGWAGLMREMREVA